MVHTWRKLSRIRQTLREEHCGVCFEWEFVPQGKLLYILDGDNVKHGLNCDLSFKAENRAKNIWRIENEYLINRLSFAFKRTEFVREKIHE
ncbi:unnamed protein product [Malus baccata var. baccata]